MSNRLSFAFFAVVLLMAGHQAEHVAQMVEKNTLGNPCPAECRGALGFIFDIEWVHVAYNHSLLVLLAALYVAFAMWRPHWRRANPLAWTLMTVGVFAIQGYHVVEHTVKLDQWLANGHKSPTPGLLGQLLPAPLDRNFSLIELHFTFNTVVFSAVLAAYFLWGFHRRVPRVQPAVPAIAVAVLLILPIGVAWATRTPTVHLAAGVHEGPLVLDRSQKLVGADGAVVRGGIVVTADNVIVRGVRTVGGEYGIEVRDSVGVRIEDVTVERARMDGINARQSSVLIRNCRVVAGPSAEGIEVSFSMHPSTVAGCRVSGGEEGIKAHMTQVRIRDNVVTGTSLRGITITEMAHGVVERNKVRDAVGTGIFCTDYSLCTIRDNHLLRIRPDASGQATRAGVAIASHYSASAHLAQNRVDASPGGIAAFVNGQITRTSG